MTMDNIRFARLTKAFSQWMHAHNRVPITCQIGTLRTLAYWLAAQGPSEIHAPKRTPHEWAQLLASELHHKALLQDAIGMLLDNIDGGTGPFVEHETKLLLSGDWPELPNFHASDAPVFIAPVGIPRLLSVSNEVIAKIRHILSHEGNPNLNEANKLLDLLERDVNTFASLNNDDDSTPIAGLDYTATPDLGAALPAAIAFITAATSHPPDTAALVAHGVTFARAMHIDPASVCDFLRDIIRRVGEHLTADGSDTVAPSHEPAPPEGLGGKVVTTDHEPATPLDSEVN